MKLNFIGAAHEVTGSCHHLEVCGKHILIDCGMEQGPDLYERQQMPAEPAEIDYVLLTHAHIDHSGLIPLLQAKGFTGSVYATKATTDLCDIMLKDSAYIQEFEAEWRNRKAKRSGQELYAPLYSTEDAVQVMTRFIPCPYDTKITLCEGIQIRFINAGHLLGAASIEVWAREGANEKKLVFSGDIGNIHKPLLKNPQYIHQADYVIMESTYGNRDHGDIMDLKNEFTQILEKTFARNGNVVIPSFAVGRTQEMLYLLREIKEESRLPGYQFEVFVDSPLAIEATNIFTRNEEECFDEEAMKLVRNGINPISFPGLRTTISSSESKEINFDQKPKVIISASGMCEAGRIKHHLKHNLWRPECTILFVGYQAHGTLGRRLIEGAKEVKLFGEPIEVKAEIRNLQGISGHADRKGLVKWITAFHNRPERVFIVHGNDQVCDEFAETVREKTGFEAIAPYPGAVFDLITNQCIETGYMKQRQKPAKKRATQVFDRLMAAGLRLMDVIRKNKHAANKDMAKFTSQIHALCDKWDQ